MPTTTNSCNQQITQYDVQTGNAVNSLNQVPPQASGTVLTSTGTSSQPSFQAPAASSKVTTYSNPGSFTWTMDARTQTVEIWGWAGGGGGGSGRKGTTGAAGG